MPDRECFREKCERFSRQEARQNKGLESVRNSTKTGTTLAPTLPALISVDWGTTSLRCALLARDGSILERRDGGPGIQPPPPAGFAGTLSEATASWRTGQQALPIVMSGMIGSRQGWREVPYLPCPTTSKQLADALMRVDGTAAGEVYIVPGLAITPDRSAPEVMRGEETQIIGALASVAQSQGREHLFVLPGTHSKWATTTANAITSFSTYMTGEVFAALRAHTILGRLMPEGASEFHAAGFEQGVHAGTADGSPGALLNRLFATRTLGLFDRLPAAALESYLSGLLIGAELAAATTTATDPFQDITIIGNAGLSERYLYAAQLLGLAAEIAPPDCAARGHLLIADAAGLLKASPS